MARARARVFFFILYERLQRPAILRLKHFFSNDCVGCGLEALLAAVCCEYFRFALDPVKV